MCRWMSSRSFGFLCWLRGVWGASFGGAAIAFCGLRVQKRRRRQKKIVCATAWFWLRELLIFVLKLVKLPINAAHRQQFLMRSNLAELALVHHQDAIRTLDS